MKVKVFAGDAISELEMDIPDIFCLIEFIKAHGTCDDTLETFTYHNSYFDVVDNCICIVTEKD